MKMRYDWPRLVATAVAFGAVSASVMFGLPRRMSPSAVTLSAAQATAGKRSVREGIYTEEQAAKRGRVVYRRCILCHLDDGNGDASKAVLPIAGDEFWKRWEGKSLRELYEKIQTTMPEDNPGGLLPDQYVDVLTYIFFQLNKLPAGQQELTVDQLDQIEVKTGG